MHPTRRQLRNRHGGYARALINLVAPLAAPAATDTHATDTGQLDLFGPAASGAAAALGAKPEWNDPDPDNSEPPYWMALELRNRKGGDMAEWPEDLRVREYPRA